MAMTDPANFSPSPPLTVAEAFQQALAHHQAGRLSHADHLYRRILQADPRHADSNHNLGIIALQINQPQAALPLFRLAVEAEPRRAQFWYSYIAALVRAGKKEDARKVFHQAEGLGFAGPEMTELASRVNKAPDTSGQPFPEEVQALLGHFSAGRFEQAAQAASAITTRYPRFPLGWKVLGPALMKLGNSREALVAMQTAVVLAPSDPHAHYNLSAALKTVGRLEEAATSARRALESGLDALTGYLNLGGIEYQRGRYDAAIACCQRVLELKPDSVEGHMNLANALFRKGLAEQAARNYRRVLEFRSDLPAAHAALGTILRDQSRYDAAAEHFRRACDLEPHNLSHQVSLHLMVPAIAESQVSIEQVRSRFRLGLGALAQSSAVLDEKDGPPPLASFYLAYHGENDRDLMTAMGALYRQRWRELGFVAPHLENWAPGDGHRRIRIGFLSAFLTGHTIAKLYQGFLRHLDREQFEVCLIRSPDTKPDTIGQQIDSCCDRVISLGGPLRLQQQQIADLQLDVLFYPDIGMSPWAYCLAHARLAPVQAVGWGHPVTTGLSSIDYFLSADSIEPQGADEHYAETLIRFRRLPCFYEPFIVPKTAPSRDDLNLPGTGTLYGCPQSLFKLHPDFDPVLASIVTSDSGSHIILLEGTEPSWKEQLRARWSRKAPVLLERTVFLPRLTLDRFMGLIANLDVLLDPIHFGSGNTLYEAMAYGVPIVTWPGPFMRGRVVAGAYRQMGIQDAPIVHRMEDYALAAVTLGRDPGRRARMRGELAAAARRELFADMRAVQEFESFLVASVNAATERRKLTADWRSELHGTGW